MSISEWLDMMPESVTINARTGQSVTGAATYAPTGTSYQARIELKNRLIVDAKGREILSRGRIYLGTAAVIGIQDKLTLPSDYVPLNPPILAVNIVPDDSGNHNTVLEIG